MLAPHPTLSRFNTRFERSIFVGTVLDELHLWQVSTYNDHEEVFYLNTLCLPGLASIQLLPQTGNGARLLFELPCRNLPSLLREVETDDANTSVKTREEQPYCLSGECIFCHTYECRRGIGRGETRVPMDMPSKERSSQPVMDPVLFEDPFAQLTTVSSGDPHSWGHVRHERPAGGPEFYATPTSNGVIFSHQDYGTSQVRLRLATRTHDVETFGREFVPKENEVTISMPGPVMKLQLAQMVPVQGLIRRLRAGVIRHRRLCPERPSLRLPDARAPPVSHRVPSVERRPGRGR